MFAVDVISRIVHVGTAITLIGGSAFMLLVLLPSVKRLGPAPHDQLATAITGRWKWFVHGGIALFLISGGYNYWRALSAHEGDGLYHMLVGTKILMALVIFFLAAALVGRSSGLQRLRDQRPRVLAVIVLLAAIIVVISGFVKVRGVPPIPSDAVSAGA